ncbi:hypothetical protein [Paenibacillus monticola]|uniref:Uncharacterized protein n=1 Tax=Paenibacillus monticola TaxID=2666075 RepID=A0A7X2L4S9_9BACL|nr:hypothetical protein [Paenibacillus monticola]MRN56665.1 hypothetical protein [Paenibacillus monticola]
MLPQREELQRLLKKANQHAVAEAKKAGASIYYIKDGKRIREDATGQKFEITYDVAGNRTELASHD